VVKFLVKIAKANAVALLGERLVKLGAGALITIIVARMLGPEATGYYSIVMTWSAFLAPLANLGLNNLVQKSVHAAAAHRTGTQILFTATWLRLIAGFVFAALMFISFSWYLPAEFEPYQLGAAVLFVGQLFNAFILFEFHQNYLGQFRPLAYRKLGLGILGLLAKLAVLWLGLGIGALFWIVGLEFAAVGLLQYQMYLGHCKSINTESGRLTPAWFNWQHGKELLRRSSWLWISGILSVVYLRIDLIMIERLIDIEAAGVYAAVSRMSELWYVIPATLAVRYYPELLKSHQNSWSGYLLLLRKYCGYFLAMALTIAVVIFLIAPPLVPLIFGEKFQEGISVLQIHIWAGVFIFIRYLIGQHLIITNQEPLSLASHGIGAVLNVLLNWWLIPIMGIDGAAWATLLSYAYASFFFLFFSSRTRRQLWQLIKVKASGVVVEKETV
jgi:O-antigen/teichoic acid export membrane protein